MKTRHLTSLVLCVVAAAGLGCTEMISRSNEDAPAVDTADPGPDDAASDFAVVEVKFDDGAQAEAETVVDDPAVEVDPEVETVVEMDEPGDEPESVDVPDAILVDHMNDGVCVLDCVGRACGDDGCGGICGFCKYGEECITGGQCVVKCDPKAHCAGKTCGSDGCGGSCGDCPQDYHCDVLTQNCKQGACAPDCTGGRECGTDGCDGSCGSCAPSQICTQDGFCTASPCAIVDPVLNSCVATKMLKCLNYGLPNEMVISIDCNTKLGSDGKTAMICGYDSWTGVRDCIDKPPCVPVCTDDLGAALECGDGGCVDKPDACGVCPQGWGCPKFHCKPVVGATCGYVLETGFCFGDVLYHCSGDPYNGGVVAPPQDCTATSQVCRWNNANGQFVCRNPP